ncbi:glycoside hydrolase family 43 protein [Paenibacillus nuruki]|uniref:glycoside hydrolase family 43 protein n=1 Tax=Paenibacillus nuruki TaxID=1886670 RepID=UPI002804F66E|nr:family 43 glycosylhydrolase [Paenibacillus nuruki]CAJ1315314.1 Xylan 1,4-beta-xylosidase [Paenibacillus nuruki]
MTLQSDPQIYTNPIIHEDYSDPDAIAVGDDFYMVASSFAHVPGLPLLHSTDLVHWKLIHYILPKLEFLEGSSDYDQPRHGEGVWAPSLRYQNGRFWVFFSTPDEGVFMCSAEQPTGPWTAPHMLKKVKGWIDPCPFWDEDGQAYLVHAFAHSRSGIRSKLQMFRMSADGRELLGEGQIVYDGGSVHPVMEGPKCYKREGKYYLFAPAGGVSHGWQVVLRADHIFGPYEDRIVLQQGNSEVNGPHQGSWVETSTGESWFLHFQDKYAYGRITHLQPMQWDNGWPIIGQYQQGQTAGEPVSQWRMPVTHNKNNPANEHSSEDQASNITSMQPYSLYKEQIQLLDGATQTFGSQWQWQANPQPDWYATDDEHQELRLYACPFVSREVGLSDKAVLYDAPQLLLQKLPSSHFTATTRLQIAPKSVTEKFGLTVFGRTYTYLAIEQNEDQHYRLSLTQGYSDQHAKGQALDHPIEEDIWQTDLHDLQVNPSQPHISNPIYLRVSVWLDTKQVDHPAPASTAREDQIPVSILHAGLSQFSYSLDGSHFIDIPHIEPIHPGHWVGAKVGIFAVDLKKRIEPFELTSDDQDTIGYAEYSTFFIEQQH